jgi:hypothetical protein
MNPISPEELISCSNKEDSFSVAIDRDNLLFITVYGEGTAAGAVRWGDATRVCVDVLRKHGLPVLVLYDVTKLNIFSSGDTAARSKLVEVFNGFDFDSVAIYGKSSVLTPALNLLIHLYPKFSKLKIFNTEDEARTYLLQQKTAL